MYDPQILEKRWQKIWEKAALYKIKVHPPKKYYILEMYPYPSGDLHMGQFRNYILGDTIARLRSMQGYNVLHPFGWDAFGLPAEEAAIKRKIDPNKWTANNIQVSRTTLKLMGISYDWNREINTSDPAYYKWTQWLFLKLFERGLAYRKEAFVNWCPHCQTVLANEQVESGECWRCNSSVAKKELTQWFFKITAYAERLLTGLEKLHQWPEQVKTLQRNWIGKSEGLEIDFLYGNRKIPVFTTRPDTIYGVTFMAIAPENKLVKEIVRGTDKEKEVINYIKKSLQQSEIERASTTKIKDGVFTGKYAINPLSNEKVQLWVADYVLPSYGTGVVMGVPAHDQRDFEFAQTYKIPIKIVIQPKGEKLSTLEEAYVEPGIMVNSGPFNGILSTEGMVKIGKYVEEKGVGRRKVNYRLKDWLISRQRYWGAPIPMIYCKKCGLVPVPYEKLPVLLPQKVDFTPQGTSPLAAASEFINTKCPKCSSSATRDPDTMDTFVDSSWYHLRYMDPKNDKQPFSQKAAQIFFPVDEYIGGIEHATGHLIYFRFITKFLHDEGLLPDDEPCVKLFTHGMITDKNGVVMAKSKGNAVPVGPFVKKWGADTGRLTMLFIGPPDKDSAWSEEGITGINRFLSRVFRLVHENLQENVARGYSLTNVKLPEEITPLCRVLNQTIKKVTQDIQSSGHNTAISSLMEFVNELYKSQNDPWFGYAIHILVQLLAPFAPHLSEDLWQQLGNEDSVFKSQWPSWKEIEAEEVTVIIEINGKLRASLTVPINTEQAEIEKLSLQIPKIAARLKGKEIKKIIFVPNKLINFVSE